MDNQHRQVKGDRELSQAEIDVMNEVKALGTQIEAVVTKLNDLTGTDKSWIAIGATKLQHGLMALTRGITRPTFF